MSIPHAETFLAINILFKLRLTLLLYDKLIPVLERWEWNE